MNYAKYISDTEIQLPTQEDYLEDGITLKTPEIWSEYYPSEKPTDTMFDTYYPTYQLMSYEIDKKKSIYQIWRFNHYEPEGRVGKLINGNIITPQKNERINNSLITNYDKLPNSRKILDGWLLIEETSYPTDGKTYIQKGILIDDSILGKKIKIVWQEIIPEIIPDLPFDISKLKLKRALDNMGKWEEFKIILEQNPDYLEEFNLAVTLMSNDTLVILMSQICSQQFGLTEEQVKALLISCKSDLSNS